LNFEKLSLKSHLKWATKTSILFNPLKIKGITIIYLERELGGGEQYDFSNGLVK